MGHYYSEMYLDNRTKKEKDKQAKKEIRKEDLENTLCDIFKCKKNELYLVYKILKDSWVNG